jgi:hypothetical protein
MSSKLMITNITTQAISFYVYAHEGRGGADCSEHRKVAGAVALRQLGIFASSEQTERYSSQYNNGCLRGSMAH